MKLPLALVGLATITAVAASPDFQSRHVAVGFDRARPQLSYFALDGLGTGKLAANEMLDSNGGAAVDFTRLATNRFGWTPAGMTNRLVWEVVCGESSLTFRSRSFTTNPLPPLVFLFNQKAGHATLLGLMDPGDRRMKLPCVLHLPDCGSARITSNVKSAKLDYDARRWGVSDAFVRVEFPAATPAHPLVEYHLDVAAIYPDLQAIKGDPQYDGFRRGFLNIFQVNPRTQMLANNASSDMCSFTLYKYAEVARRAPPLANGLTCLDLVRMTLDQYLAGSKGYGQAGYACSNRIADLVAWRTPWTSLDTYPSLLITACYYAEGAGDWKWARTNYPGLAAWGRELLATDKDGNGLFEYPGTGNFGDRPLEFRRPSNWWDTINFGHEDAYANALAYQALNKFSGLARRLGHKDDAKLFAARAEKLRAAYLPTFLDPQTGVLAGWHSADGQLHDYWFTFVQGAAITYGLIDPKPANAIMDRMLAKMQAVGYTNFALGLPGNLVPVRKGDYISQHSQPHTFGEPQLDDGSDGFQYYENGGATGCFTWFTIKALYQLGRPADADRIFEPVLQAYARGEFQGFDQNGGSRDWRDWSGTGHGYEGLLVDNYLALLAVFDKVGQAK